MQGPTESLSERELEILRLVATGAANKEIARQLVISPNTVKVHLRNIFAKIGVASRTEATLFAMSTGLVKSGAIAQPGEEAQPGGLSPSVEAEVTAAGPAIVIEESLGRPGRKFNIWQAGAGVLAVLLLVFSGLAGGRLLSSPVSSTPIPANIAPVQQPATQIPQINHEKAPLQIARKGMAAVEYDNAFYLAGGETSQGIDNALLRYNPEENTWAHLASKPTPVTEVQAALLGEKIYIPGGRLQNGTETSVLEIYDPRQNTWEQKSPMPVPLSAYALAAFEGQLYLFGGKKGGAYVSTVYSYDPKEDRWQERSPLSTPRAFAGAAVLNGKILVLGGFDGQKALQLNQAYFPNRDATGETPWETYQPLPAARYGMGIGQLAGFVFLIGGIEKDTNKISHLPVLQYIVSSDQWNELNTVPLQADAYSALLVAGNNIYQVGGETADGLSTANQSYQAIYTISVPIIGSGE